MGTRHLIEVKLGGELKVAQYGQWDGYPEGQGADIARFLHEAMDKEKFLANLATCRFLNEDDQPFLDSLDPNIWTTTQPWLSRDAGAKVFRYIQENAGLALRDSREFKEDKLFCEYHYLIDMDSETVTMNGGISVPFAEWTVARMKTIEPKSEE
jgi:hypothetical protein